MWNNIFEEIKHINEFWNEYWSARELFKILEYSEYSKFLPVIEKAKISCKKSKQSLKDHFAEVSEMIKMWLNTEKWFPSWMLSRYVCYLMEWKKNLSRCNFCTN